MPHKRHRHVVLLPLVLAGLLWPVFELRRTLTPASILSRDGQSITVGQTHFLLDEGGDLVTTKGEPWLRHGSTLAESAVLMRLKVGSVLVSGFHGGFHASVFDSGVTVAALSTPVLVTQGTGLTLVPVGYQWHNSDDNLQSLSAWFLERTLPLLSDTEALPQMPSFIEQLTWQLPLPAHLLFQAEQERRDAEQQKSQQQALEEALRVQDRDTLIKLLSNTNSSSDIASTPEGKMLLQTALFLFPADTAVTGQATSLLSDADPLLWLLLSQHPDFAELAWLSAATPDAAAIRALALRSLPKSHLSVDVLMAKRWGDEMATWFEQQEEPVAAAENARQELWPILLGLEEGYPAQAESLQAALLEAVEGVTGEATPVTPPLPLPDKESVPPERTFQMSPGAKATLHPAEVVALADRLLNQTGVLQTVQTRIEASGLQKAMVSSVMISGPRADRLFSFVIDVITGQVSGITEGDLEYSYSLPLDRFVEWAKQPARTY